MKKILALTILCLLWVVSAQAKVEQSEARTDKYTVKYPVVYIDNPSAQEAINNDIASYVARFIEAMENGIPLDKKSTDSTDRMQYVNGATH